MRLRRPVAFRLVRPAVGLDGARCRDHRLGALARLVEAEPSRGIGKCCQILGRNHPHWSHRRIYRVYFAMTLNLRRAARRGLPNRECMPLYAPEYPDRVWSADFMFDALACGRSLGPFNLLDDFHREAVHIEVGTSITSARQVRIFERIAQSARCRRSCASTRGRSSSARPSRSSKQKLQLAESVDVRDVTNRRGLVLGSLFDLFP